MPSGPVPSAAAKASRQWPRPLLRTALAQSADEITSPSLGCVGYRTANELCRQVLVRAIGGEGYWPVVVGAGLGGLGCGSQLLEGARGRRELTFEDVRKDLPGEGQVQLTERANLDLGGQYVPLPSLCLLSGSHRAPTLSGRCSPLPPPAHRAAGDMGGF
jgi:hypothetical protein